MADFNQAIGPVLQHEDPGLTGACCRDNNGAWVRWGINQGSFPAVDVPHLTLADAKAIYRRDFWDANRLGDLNNQELAGKVLDLAVNTGSREAGLLFQRAILSVGVHGVAIDGAIGPITINAANQALTGPLLFSLRNMACQFYRDLAAARPEDARYLDGWLARARS